MPLEILGLRTSAQMAQYRFKPLDTYMPSEIPHIQKKILDNAF